MATVQVRLDRNKIRNFISYGNLTPAGIVSIMNRTSLSASRDPVIKNENKTVVTKANFVTGLINTITTNNELIPLPSLDQPAIDSINSFITTAINNIAVGKRNTIKVALVIEKVNNSYNANLLITTVNGDIKSVSNILVLTNIPNLV
jgi:hypothetical protein